MLAPPIFLIREMLATSLPRWNQAPPFDGSAVEVTEKRQAGALVIPGSGSRDLQ